MVTLMISKRKRFSNSISEIFLNSISLSLKGEKIARTLKLVSVVTGRVVKDLIKVYFNDLNLKSKDLSNIERILC